MFHSQCINALWAAQHPNRCPMRCKTLANYRNVEEVKGGELQPTGPEFALPTTSGWPPEQWDFETLEVSFAAQLLFSKCHKFFVFLYLNYYVTALCICTLTLLCQDTLFFYIFYIFSLDCGYEWRKLAPKLLLGSCSR
jgi:hypothetical protein